jgi:hypothetical protein
MFFYSVFAFAKFENNNLNCIFEVEASKAPGRNYLEVGQFTETVLLMNNVKFIAINDDVDSANGKEAFNPFRNIMKNV